MLVCDGCGTVWRVRMHACGRCGALALRPFGSVSSDRSHPVAGRVPLPPRVGVVVVADSVVTYDVTRRPGDRARVADWRAYALHLGGDPAEVASATKAELSVLTEELGGVLV